MTPLVLDKARSVLDWWLVPLARVLHRANPDHFTWAALVAAAVGGAAFLLSGPQEPWLLAVAFVGVGLNSLFDLLDGKIAHLTGKATKRGDYLDHAVDRFSDVLFLAGIGLSAWAHTEVGLVAVAATLLTSYMGTQAQAVGLKRNYAGFLGRADRMVLLMAAPLAELVNHAGGWTYLPGLLDVPGRATGTTYLEIVLAFFAVMGLITTVQRFVSGLRGLRGQ